MSCKYNNHLYTTTPEEVDVCFDEFEQILLSEDYESQEELNNRLNEEYFQVFELSYVEEQTRLRELKDFLNTPGMKKEVKYKVLEAQL